MDIKYAWIHKERRYAYILTVIDTFTRFTLHWQVGYTMRTRQVKRAWEEIITDYLQSADLLRKGVHIKIRNNNGPQFGSKIIRTFFEENHLNQVFTHPYTPQENGHVESFHSILASALRTLGFWDMWEEGNITREVLKNKKVKFRLNIPDQQLSDNINLREVPYFHSKSLDGVMNEYQNDMIGTDSFLHHRFKNHRQSFLAGAIIIKKMTTIEIENQIVRIIGGSTIQLFFIQPGKPTQNGYVERLNGSIRKNYYMPMFLGLYQKLERKSRNEWTITICAGLTRPWDISPHKWY